MSCWLWDLLTGDLELTARSVCWWITAGAKTYLSDPMWDRFSA